MFKTLPDSALASIRSAVEAVPPSIFDRSTKHREISGFDQIPRVERRLHTRLGDPERIILRTARE
ncbi:hypothetical protein [Haloplanus halobius]|uniref:hypothetical protein n=1 Tax=Haloplanus halobius TaxID=2934938 RepID=UPI00200FA994|nr:hypothetical protein [Haloplanus sp. XH21]